jgi:RecB family exonuclease
VRGQRRGLSSARTHHRFNVLSVTLRAFSTLVDVPSIRAHPHRLPRSFSATALDLYERCPREFALRYLTDEVDDQLPGPPLVLGNAVHAALASLMRLNEAHRPIERAHALLRFHWAQGPRVAAFLHPEEETAWGQRGLAQLRRFCEGPYASGQPFAVEEWVRAQLPNNRRVCGRVDRADRRDGALELLDYKTGTRPGDFEAGEELASRIYALAGWRTFRMPVRSIRFLWLESEQEDVWEPDMSQLADLEDELAELTERVATDRVFTPLPGDRCHRCPFRDRCPAPAGEDVHDLPVPADLPF